MTVHHDDETPQVSLDEHASIVADYLYARAQRVVWDTRESEAKALLLKAFGEKPGIGMVDGNALVRYSRVEYDLLDQALLRKHYGEVYEACKTKHIVQDKITAIA